MATPPARTEISDTYPNPSNAVARTGFGKLHDYVLGLLGATGNAAEARAALGLGSIGARNRVINGNFQINQRAVAGTVTLAAGIYGHDRWKGGAAGGTYTFAATGLDTTITITAGSLIQVIESVNVEGGNYVMTWAGTATAKIAGGSFSASGVTAAGVAANAGLTIEFSTGTATRVQVETGLSASPFDRRDYGAEWAMCQRYYQTGFVAVEGAGYATGPIRTTAYMPVSMRAVPTIGGTFAYTNANTGTTDQGTLQSFRANAIVVANANAAFQLPFTATAEL